MILQEIAIRNVVESQSNQNCCLKLMTMIISSMIISFMFFIDVEKQSTQLIYWRSKNN